MDKWLSKKQVAKMLDVTEMTVYRYMKANKIIYYKDKNCSSRTSRVRFKYSDVLNFIESMKND